MISFSPCSHAHFITAAALVDVQTIPPCAPTNALIAADEFMYVTGMTPARLFSTASVRTPISPSSRQHMSS